MYLQALSAGCGATVRTICLQPFQLSHRVVIVFP